MRLFRKYEFHVSQAQHDDYAILESIHDQGFDRAWNMDELAATLAIRGTTCFVAKIMGKGARGPKGFVIIRTLERQSEVLTIAIDREFRQRGMARALMDHVIRQLHAERVSQLFLEVSEHNVAALKFYESMKFKQISKRKAVYRIRPSAADSGNAQNANALVMQLELR